MDHRHHAGGIYHRNLKTTLMKKTVGIIGAGESGVGAALLAKNLGYDVFVSDGGKIQDGFRTELENAQIDFEEGAHDLNRLMSCDDIIKSPGIPSDAEVIQNLKANQNHILGELQFGCEHSDARIIAVTGSNGKTTTATLIHHILQSAGMDAELAGNMGIGFCRSLLKGDHEFYVLEVSSFQLDDSPEFHPYISILLNITPDHLDRYHNDFMEYSRSKMKIAQKLTSQDHFIFWADDETITQLLNEKIIPANTYPFGLDYQEGRTAYVQNETLQISIKKKLSLCQFMN